MDEARSDVAPDWLKTRASVRTRPGMYFGSVGPRGLNHIVLELVANAIDAFLADQATEVRVELGEWLVVHDDGPGLPFDRPRGRLSAAEHYLTALHDSACADQHAPHVHLAIRGLGLAPVNAASGELHVTTWRSGSRWEQRYIEGLPAGPPRRFDDAHRRGTRIALRPDSTLFGQAQPDKGRLRAILWEASHLFPGLALHLDGERFLSERGLADLAYSLATPHNEAESSYSVQTQTASFAVDIGLLGSTTSEPMVHSWVNGVRTSGSGTHVDALRHALAQRNLHPQLALLHLTMAEPRYAGPVREQLNTPELFDALYEAIHDAL